MTAKTDTASKAAAANPKTPWNGAFSFDTMTDEGRASFQSFVQASTIAAKGYGAIGNAWFDFAKETMAAQACAAEAIMGARSWSELTDAQTVQAKGAFERTLAASNHIADMTVKTTGEAMEPIRARTEDLVGRYAKPAV